MKKAKSNLKHLGESVTPYCTAALPLSIVDSSRRPYRAKPIDYAALINSPRKVKSVEEKSSGAERVETSIKSVKTSDSKHGTNQTATIASASIQSAKTTVESATEASAMEVSNEGKLNDFPHGINKNVSLCSTTQKPFDFFPILIFMFSSNSKVAPVSQRTPSVKKTKVVEKVDTPIGTPMRPKPVNISDSAKRPTRAKPLDYAAMVNSPRKKRSVEEKPTEITSTTVVEKIKTVDIQSVQTSSAIDSVTVAENQQMDENKSEWPIIILLFYFIIYYVYYHILYMSSFLIL